MVCETALSQLKQCLDKCFFKVGTTSQLYVELSSVSQLNFCHKFQVCCAVCVWSLSCGKITPLPRGLWCSFWWPVTDFSVVQYFLALTVLQAVYHQHTRIPDDGDSLWRQMVLLKTASSWLGQGVSSPRLQVKWQIHVSSPLTTQFRQLFPCTA